MRAKKILLLICLLLNFNCISAQTFTLYGDKTFGGNGREHLNNICYAGFNQFILTGASNTDLNGDKSDSSCNATSNTSDAWMLKVDTGFNIIWDKSNGGNWSEEMPFAITTVNNQHIVLACESPSDSSCEKSDNNRSYPNIIPDYWLCMLDSNGNKIWDKTLGGTSAENVPRVIELSTGDFIVSGSSSSGVNGDKTIANYGLRDYWAIKFNHSGQKLWDKVYGGTGAELYFSGNATGSSLLATENGGFLLGGTTNSPASGLISDTSRGGRDIWIIKCDSSGNKIWDKRFGGSGNDRCDHISHTNDGGYIVCGSTDSQQGFDISQPTRGFSDVWLIKLDAFGNKQWDKRYGGNNSELGVSVEELPGGGFWVSGSTVSDSGFEVTESTYGGWDYWIIKTDSAGNKLWDKRFGGPGGDYGSNFVLMPDSSIYLFGYADSGTSAVKTDAGKGGTDYWLVHFKYGYTFTGAEEMAAGHGQLIITPNPTKDICTITLSNTSLPQHSNTLTLYDISGRVLLQQPFTSSPHHLVTSSLRSGVYIVEVKDKQGRSARGKLVKE